MNNIQPVVLQVLAQAAPAPEQGSPYSGLIMMVLMMAGMYFLLIAPQRKRQKELEKLQNALEVGDSVLAAGGIYGRVVSIKDDRITLELESGRLVVHKSAIMGKSEDAAKVVQA
jgi:preprotein translocase subunit YajC